jgi:hypothetical protein
MAKKQSFIDVTFVLQRNRIRPSDVPLSLDRPCEKCHQAEGDVKLTKFVKGRRVAAYLCQKCARL